MNKIITLSMRLIHNNLGLHITLGAKEIAIQANRKLIAENEFSTLKRTRF